MKTGALLVKKSLRFYVDLSPFYRKVNKWNVLKFVFFREKWKWSEKGKSCVTSRMKDLSQTALIRQENSAN